jgi:hypothetical protein
MSEDNKPEDVVGVTVDDVAEALVDIERRLSSLEAAFKAHGHSVDGKVFLRYE